MSARSDLNVYQRLSIAKKGVASKKLVKTESKELRYPYLPIEEIKKIVEDEMNAVGLVLSPGDSSIEDVIPPWTVSSTTQWGEKREVHWFHQRINVDFVLTNVDDPSDTIVYPNIKGEAKDNSDKVINKLYTSALKNLLKMVFSLAERKDDTDSIQSDEDLERSSGRTCQSAPDTFQSKKASAKKATTATEPAKTAGIKEDADVAPNAVRSPSAPASEITTDRPPEVMRKSLRNFMADSTLASDIIDKAMAIGAGACQGKWTDEQVKELYAYAITESRSRA